MNALRPHLRVSAAAWLLLQTATLAVFVPRDCCPVHRSAAAPTTTCHTEPANDASCPMRGETGSACPMHRRGGDAKACLLKGSCNGPADALVSLFFVVGVLTDPPAIADDPPHAEDLTARGHLDVDSALAPDTRPPRT